MTTSLHSYQDLYEMRRSHLKPKGKLHDTLGYLHVGDFIWLVDGIRFTESNIITNNFGSASVLPFPFEFTARLGQIMSYSEIDNLLFMNPYVQGNQLPFGLKMPESPWDIQNTTSRERLWPVRTTLTGSLC